MLLFPFVLIMFSFVSVNIELLVGGVAAYRERCRHHGRQFGSQHVVTLHTAETNVPHRHDSGADAGA